MNLHLNRVYTPSHASNILRSCNHSTLSVTRLFHLQYYQHELSSVPRVIGRAIHSSAARLAEMPSSPQMNSSNQMSPAINKARMMDDIGLERMPKDIVGLLEAGLPGNTSTVVLILQPNLKEVRRIVKHPLLALRFLWLRFRTWATTRLTRVYHMQIYGSLWNPKTYFKGKEDRWPKRKLMAKAEDMYVHMYTAFAKGNRADLHEFCGEGIQSALESRMTRRGVGAVVEWNLISFDHKPKMISRSVGMGPKYQGRTISYQQAIFNIKSTQSLKRGRRINGSGAVLWQKETSKPVDEYLVLQRRFCDNIAEDWFLWGFLKSDNILTFQMFINEQEKRKMKEKQSSTLEENDLNMEHQSHKTVRSLTNAISQPTS